jgi:hypothetical protein
VFVTIADAASHDVALAVLRILATTVAFPARVDAVALPFALQVDKGVVVGPKEAMPF